MPCVSKCVWCGLACVVGVLTQPLVRAGPTPCYAPQAKRDSACVLATGFGKSLCYQFSAVHEGKVALCVSPLISLMQDQVNSLNASGITACFVGSAQKDPGQSSSLPPTHRTIAPNY